MSYIEAPAYHDAPPKLFLAGGITGCPDWQSEAVKRLQELSKDITIFNPRRPDFPMDDPDAAEIQITWEFHHLRLADVILFWFCAEQVQPIALFELGAWLMTTKPIAIGVDPDYPRLQDVRIQTALIRPTAPFSHDLDRTIGAALELLTQVQTWRSR